MSSQDTSRERYVNELLSVLRKQSTKGNSNSLQYRISLASNTIGEEEIRQVVEVLLGGKTTMGDYVKQFENAFSKYVGCRFAVMVNSGSSALLVKFLALRHFSLENSERLRGGEVILPAISWSTDYSSVWLARFKPVIVDINRNTLCIDAEAVEAAVGDKTKAILGVHMLGNPFPIDAIQRLVKEYDLELLEDCCEALGTRFDGIHVGSFGKVGSFSFYFSHHITTIEGGMVVTNDPDIADFARMIRAHGWIRDSLKRKKYARLYGSFDPRFVFRTIGVNVRPTEIQAAIGLIQLRKLDTFLKIRSRNAEYLRKRIEEELNNHFTTLETPLHGMCSWFLFPVIKREGSKINIQKLIKFMEKKGIELRPVTTGNVVRQPFFRYLGAAVRGRLNDADYITKNSFCLGIHQDITPGDCDFIFETLREGVRLLT